jgi:GAF domain-containing protein
LATALPTPWLSDLDDVAIYEELVRSAVRLARLAFRASASSIFVYDQDRDQLVFEASSGTGEDRLVGIAVPADQGIAGWVWQTGEAVIAADLANDRRFDLDFAQRTGYVPDTILAAPLRTGETMLGLIEVLDPVLDGRSEISAIDLLAELANHLSATVSLLAAARRAAPGGGWGGAWQRLAATVEHLAGRDRAAVDTFVRALDGLLAPRRTGHA